MAKRKITQQDFDNNPELQLNGLKVGDEIDVPESEETNEYTNEQTAASDDTGGSAPPPDKPRDD